jgi:chromatin remodeling complex protein RSC6
MTPARAQISRRESQQLVVSLRVRGDLMAKKATSRKTGKSSKTAKSRGSAKRTRSTKSARGGSAKKAKKTARKRSGGGGRGTANAAFMRPVQPSASLAEVVGEKPIPRSEVTKRLWAYIKKNKLQDQKNKRMINADAALRPVFGGKSAVNMFEMTKLVNKQLK